MWLLFNISAIVTRKKILTRHKEGELESREKRKKREKKDKGENMMIEMREKREMR